MASTIRELIQETNAMGKAHPLFKEMSAALGYDAAAKKPQVTIMDNAELAVVCIDEKPVGVLSVDWSEPCLEFKPLAK